MSIISFNDNESIFLHIREHGTTEVTVYGVCTQVIPTDTQNNPISSDNCETIWLNSSRDNNDFSIRLTNSAVTKFKEHPEFQSIHKTPSKFIIICNNKLLQSVQGTDKPYIGLSSEEDFKDLVIIGIDNFS